MKDFQSYLNQTDEVGYVDQVVRSIIYAHGLPNVHPGEVVLFETGQIGYVLGLNEKSIEVLLLSAKSVNVGCRIARTNRGLEIRTDDSLLGKVITSLDFEKTLFALDSDDKQVRPIDEMTTGFSDRSKVSDPLETGVTLVDMIVPLGKGQRQLVIGDRKTGKSSFLLQTVMTQAAKGCICIYTLIAKPQLEIQRIADFFKAQGIDQTSVIVSSHSTDRPGLVFLTPYVAMTIAEHFRDAGKDVILIFDDLTSHARYYREAMLLARRFPGRSSYPGDIFYIHARLLERAGSFAKGSITCLPVAQSVLGDLSGYIQSNIMSMTDGHILFDGDLFDQGRRPAINPFLSVTRVGEQTQPHLVKEVSRHLRSFLVSFEKIKQFKHFQTELGESTRNTFDLGTRITTFMDQGAEVIVPTPLNVVMYTGLLAFFWKNIPLEQMKEEMNDLLDLYNTDAAYKAKIDEVVSNSKNMAELTGKLNNDSTIMADPLKSLRAKTVTTPPATTGTPTSGAPTTNAAPLPEPQKEATEPGVNNGAK